MNILIRLLLVVALVLVPWAALAQTVVSTTCQVQVVNPTPECSDGLNNDGDAFTDYSGNDPGCSGPSDTTEAPNPPVATLTAAPDPVASGSRSTLTWSCTDSTNASISGIGAVTPAAGGSIQTPVLSNPPSTTYPYTLTCTGASGSDTDSYTVDVINPSVELTANPDRVNPGDDSLISWVGNLVTACSVTRDGAAFVSSGPPTGSQNALDIVKQTLFNITCDGGATDSAIVNIIPAFEEF